MTTNPIVNTFWPQSTDDKKKKQTAQQQIKNSYDTPFEAFRDLGNGALKNVKSNTKAAGTDIMKQLFGGDKPLHKIPKTGEMTPGQDVDIASLQNQKQEAQKQEVKMNIRPGIEQRDYVGEILRAGEEANKKESEETKQQVERIIVEIKNISRSSKVLEQKVIEATGSNMVKPGRYHKNFLDHVFSILRDARAKIDNAGSWLSAMKGKQNKKGMGNKKQKTNYWDMAKKHGSNFTLSGERAVSNQVG